MKKRRPKSYNKWLDLHQEWRKSCEIMVPNTELSLKLRECNIEILEELSKDPSLIIPSDFLFDLACQLKTWHAGSKLTYLWHETRLKQKLADPLIADLKLIAVEYIMGFAEDSGLVTKARKKVRDIYKVPQSTLNDWETEAMYNQQIIGRRITIEELVYAGNFYKMITNEMKHSPLILTDNDGEKFEVKDPVKFRKHIFLEHSTGTSIHEEEGHYFTVDDKFRKLIS